MRKVNLRMNELEKHKKVSANLNEMVDHVPKEKKVYIPPLSHPWKATSFKKQLEKAHINHVYA